MEKWDPFHLHNYLETIFIHSIFACVVCDYCLIQIFYAIFCFVLSSVSCQIFFFLFIVNSISTHLYIVVVNTLYWHYHNFTNIKSSGNLKWQKFTIINRRRLQQERSSKDINEKSHWQINFNAIFSHLL